MQGCAHPDHTWLGVVLRNQGQGAAACAKGQGEGCRLQPVTSGEAALSGNKQPVLVLALQKLSCLETVL